MSSASTPAPRVKDPSAPRSHTLFWPIFVLLVGVGWLAVYQLMTLEEQLDNVTRAVDKMDSKVKLAQHEKNLFYALARDVMVMAPQDPNAEKIVVEFKLRELKAAQPTLFEQPVTAPSSEPSGGLQVPANVAPTAAALDRDSPAVESHRSPGEIGLGRSAATSFLKFHAPELPRRPTAWHEYRQLLPHPL